MSKDKIHNSESIFKNLEENSEYVENQKQIDCITKVLIEHSDVPPKLIDWLIEAVEENAALKYKLSK